jgi:hypothetical protein
MEWSDWFQNVAGGVIDKAAAAKYTQPYEIDKLRLQALGQVGYYEEGQAGTAATAAQPGLFGMSQGATVLLIGGAVLLFVLSKD